MTKKRDRDVLTLIYDVLGSYGLAILLLLCLFALTLFGTLYQVEWGLYAAKKRFFESWFLWTDVAGVSVPFFPGGVTCMGLLAVNMLVGGLLRMRFGWRTAGVIVVHVGIAFLLVSGLVKLVTAEEGHLTLYEGEQSGEFQSYYDWEVAVWEPQVSGEVVERVIPHEHLADLADGAERTFESADLPFELVLSNFERNCRVLPEGPMWKPAGEVVDGYGLAPKPPEATAERNAAGLLAEVRGADGTTQRGILWAHDRAPWTVQVDGRDWLIDLRHARYSMPFTVRLEDFVKEDHPGISMAKAFRSDVTKVQSGREERVRIQMNEPLRHEGLVLFQSSWGPSNAGPGDRLFSTFSVTRNVSDKWPEYSMWVITLGIVMAFGRKLFLFVRSQNRKRGGTVQAAASAAARTLALALGLALAAGTARAQDVSERTEPWDAETLDLFATLPVQDGGRIKPMDSVAGLRLLRLNGKRKLETPDGERITPTAWLLDCLFFPEQAVDYACFRVQHDGVLTTIGLEPKGKRAWYSYQELAPGRARLFQEASEVQPIEAARRTPVQAQTLKLAGDVQEFERTIGFLEFARREYSTNTTEALKEVFGEDRNRISQVVSSVGELRHRMRGLGQAGLDSELAAMQVLDSELREAMSMGGNSLLLFTPPESVEDTATWWSPGDVVMAAFGGHLDLARLASHLAAFERLEDAKTDPAAFRSELETLHASLVADAEARGEYGRIPLEVKLYGWNVFTNSLVFYILAFVLMGATLLAPRARWLRWGTWGSTGVALALAVFGITLRCIIRQRPPVVTLYDTILFITSCTVLVSLAMEWLTRQRIALGVSIFLGVAGMFLAGKYELKEVQSAGDTMASVVAVLDTNYYLAIHVTTIALGYAGGLLAAAIAHVWILGKLLGFRRDDKAFYKSVSRMTYGIVCFSLLFSIFGTIMGGVWANDSWGRFWGWDPKENGALLICIWNLVILHCRLGGYIRDRGLAVMAVFGGMVVAASWWGVNLLNVGLHSYGFTSGVAMTLFVFWGLESLVMLLAGVDRLVRRQMA